MTKHLVTLLAAFSLACAQARAEDLNLNERPDTVGAALSSYSFGLGAGTLASLSDALKDESEMFMKVSVIQSIAFTEMMIAGLDLDWNFPGTNWAGMLNLDFALGRGAFRPFVGAGAGMSYFNKRGEDFGEGLGPAGKLQAGFLLDVMDELQLRVRVPFTITANHEGDRTVGLDVGLLFGSPLRKTRVKKLIY